MRHGALAALAAICVMACAGVSVAAPPGDAPAVFAIGPTTRPVYLQEVESIYAPPTPKQPSEFINEGGVNFDLGVNYMTDYVYRGVDRSEVGGAEDGPNLQFDGRFEFNFGRLPHPYAGVFVNVYDEDPVSDFQEIRPFVGFEWDLGPVIVDAGNNTYIYPERDDDNTNEVFLRLTLNDSFIWKTDKPVLRPYVFAAYDYDLYDATYLEAGIRYRFDLGQTGVSLEAVADVAYVLDHPFYSRPGPPGGFITPGRPGLDESGFQHYDIGLIGTYSLNTLLNLPRRYGEWKLRGYLFYTDGLDDDLRADTQVWGGMGIQFRY